jgi:pyrroline-5-carboxylate reductase
MRENSLHDKHFAVIGIGNIGRILIGRLQASGVPARQIVVCDTVPERSAAAAAIFGVKAAATTDDLTHEADVILLAVPPKAALDVLQRMSGQLRADQIVISFAAAVPLAKLEELTPDRVMVARVMPNAPSMLGQGMNPVVYSRTAPSEARALVESLLASLGQTIEVRDDQMNWCVGLSGAAMRSLLPVLEGMTQAGFEAGLPPDEACQVAAQVMMGTAALVLQSGLSFEHIKGLTPMETVDDAALSRLFLDAAREAKEKIDHLEAKLWRTDELGGAVS